MDTRRVAIGGISEVVADVRLVLREAIMARATAVVLCHNHPSGSIHPSRHDDSLTDRLRQACEVMNIRFIDHVIVTDGRYYSYVDEGRL
jgi:DNA repair protein RadC